MGWARPVTKAGSGERRPAPSRLRAAAGRLDRLLGYAVAATLFFMMWVTFIDVVMREVLPGSFPAADELTKLSLGVLVFAALPLITARGGHVTIALFDTALRGRARRVRGLAVNLVGAGVLGVFCWRLALLALRFGSYGDATLFLGAPLAPFAWLMSALAGLSAALLLAHAWRHARGIESGP